MVQTRLARATDAEAGIATLRRSITELCEADHAGDAGQLEAWLRNKTIANWMSWIAREDAVLLVAERDGEIVGVGSASFRGEVLLNYVHPKARFTGVSKALLAALEIEVRRHGARQCRLQSTVTARSFYSGCGYRPEPDGTTYLKDLSG
jgi:GNAT superfamily N-acetyltransferase